MSGEGGRPKHLVTLAGMEAASIHRLLDRAASLREQFQRERRVPPMLRDRCVVNLFFEPSTRTRSSFELAASRLGAHALNFDIALSSTGKGETLEDTLATLEAMDADAFVVRHKVNGTPRQLADHARRASIINAGDGNHAHPTQGLLDMLTIRDRRGTVEGCVVTICGDIAHSRVARSDIDALRILGASEIRLCGPASLLPDPAMFPDCIVTHDFDAAIDGVDVVIMLRLQKERMLAGLVADEAAYFIDHGLDSRRLGLAGRDVIVMHPGPMNRGIEIASTVADGPNSAVLDQVANGVFVRMSVLVELIGIEGEDKKNPRSE